MTGAAGDEARAGCRARRARPRASAPPGPAAAPAEPGGV